MRIDHQDESIVVIGSGAGGGTLANELCQQGFDVVLLESGPFIDPKDFTNHELDGYMQLSWTEPRNASGSFGLATTSPSSPAWMGRAVGGGTNLWGGVAPRFLKHEFTPRSTYGDIDGSALIDWPVTSSEMVPYYQRAEVKMGVSHRNGRPPLPATNNYKVLANGASRVGYHEIATGPYAVNRDPYMGRPGTIHDGFSFTGDKTGARWSTLSAEIPAALATGRLDLRPGSHALNIGHDTRGRVTSVTYATENGSHHRQSARLVVLAANSLETPRLLLLSQSALFPDGLGNGAGNVGRHYMRHVTGTVYGQFDKEVHAWRGEIMSGLVGDEAHHDPSRGFAGGYYFEPLWLGPHSYATLVEMDSWGSELVDRMEAYARTAGVWFVGEDMPRAENRITLDPDVVDHRGLPVAHVHYDDMPNDLAMSRHARAAAVDIFRSVGAVKTHHADPYASGHNLGSCRMASSPEDGVLDAHGRAHEVPNLFVVDGSAFTSSAAANPTLTIVALALRQADHITEELRARRL